MKGSLCLFLSSSVFAIASLCDSSSVVQGGALAILGWTVWYVLARALPGERKVYIAAQKEERKEFLESLASFKHTLDGLAAALTGRLL